MKPILQLIFFILFSQFMLAEEAEIALPKVDEQEANLKKISDSYLIDELKMNPQVKTATITKDFSEWKKRFLITDISKSYRILAKFNDKDVWLIHYINKNDDGSPKIGNGAGEAKLIVDTTTSKIVGIWLMPK